jgi:hypothetical protein
LIYILLGNIHATFLPVYIVEASTLGDEKIFFQAIAAPDISGIG